MALEADSDDPEKSSVFSKYPKFLKDHHALAFVCDTIRMASGGGVEPFDVDQMMELDMDVHHHDTSQPIAALSTMADALPGLASSPRCSASSSPWAPSAGRPKKSATR